MHMDRQHIVIFLKGAQSRLNGLKSLAKLFKFVVCNPCESSPSLTILVPLWFIIISLMFFYLHKVLFSGFLQFNGNFVDAQINSKLKEFSHGIPSCFGHVQNYLEIEGNLKIILYEDRKNTKEIIINHKGTRMVKDGED